MLLCWPWLVSKQVICPIFVLIGRVSDTQTASQSANKKGPNGGAAEWWWNLRAGKMWVKCDCRRLAYCSHKHEPPGRRNETRASFTISFSGSAALWFIYCCCWLLFVAQISQPGSLLEKKVDQAFSLCVCVCVCPGVVLGCDRCSSHTDESRLVPLRQQRFDVTPRRDLGLLLNHVCVRLYLLFSEVSPFTS